LNQTRQHLGRARVTFSGIGYYSNRISSWAQFGIQPKTIAYKLWTQSRPVPVSAITGDPDIKELATAAAAVDRSTGGPPGATAGTNDETKPIQPLVGDDVA
jgi:hypothetical protein